MRGRASSCDWGQGLGKTPQEVPSPPLEGREEGEDVTRQWRGRKRVLRELVPGHQVAHTHQETPIFIPSHSRAQIQGQMTRCPTHASLGEAPSVFGGPPTPMPSPTARPQPNEAAGRQCPCRAHSVWVNGSSLALSGVLGACNEENMVIGPSAPAAPRCLQ